MDGVKDADGKMVIRPLNHVEKDILNKFYEETVITNFSHNPKIKALLKRKKAILEDDTVLVLVAESRSAQKAPKPDYKRIKQLKELINITKKQNEEIYADELFEIEETLKELREEHLLYPDVQDHKKFYNDNNSRNACIYNMKKTSRNLVYLDVEDYDKYIAGIYSGIDAEFQLINDVERLEEEREELKRLESLQKIKKLAYANSDTDDSGNET